MSTARRLGAGLLTGLAWARNGYVKGYASGVPSPGPPADLDNVVAIMYRENDWIHFATQTTEDAATPEGHAEGIAMAVATGFLALSSTLDRLGINRSTFYWQMGNAPEDAYAKVVKAIRRKTYAETGQRPREDLDLLGALAFYSGMDPAYTDSGPEGMEDGDG